jgi:hypothetical protein
MQQCYHRLNLKKDAFCHVLDQTISIKYAYHSANAGFFTMHAIHWKCKKSAAEVKI